MNRFARRSLALLAGAWMLAVGGAGAAEPLTVYKSPACGCCSSWIAHLKAAGFEVQTHERDDMDRIKHRLGVPTRLRSCHTAKVGGYVIEGHVPAADIRRLLEARPEVAGLAVPGMPVGSPGMEGGTPQPYAVIAYDGYGRLREFARH